MRLFAGIGLPDSIRGALAALQPPASRGVRLVHAEDMHITLHFIGDADGNVIGHALESVVCPAFAIRLSGVGRFRMRNGRQILWVGVDTDDALRRLHRSCARALAAIGFEAEKREYRPHITMARLNRSVPRGLVRSFLQNENRDDLGSFHVDRFSLYNSETSDDRARYTILQSYELQ